jgi:hypothetical protein
MKPSYWILPPRLRLWRQGDYAAASASNNETPAIGYYLHAYGFGGKGIRTPGLFIANEALYQLSYTPELCRAAESLR